MGSSPSGSRLTRLQSDLLAAFFRRENRFFLTGGGALAGFYFAHRETDDLDLFCTPEQSLDEGVRALEEAAVDCGARLTGKQHHPDFRRLLAERGEERCLVDLVVDRAPAVERDKATFGEIRVDTLREIAANKICTLVGRAEIKDLVDLRALLAAGVDLEQAVADALTKDGGADPATLAWLLAELTIGPTAPLPSGLPPEELLRFRDELIPRLRALAFAQVRVK
ncbi:MAG: nucleotidyl transferase AbiEii/AbiGii toxin family protein [Deltaproteobacteria bacterium]|nr:nucleotidyl transferase AbiEii/AbiGii toxin family protein [Deltaproteobacteria bacterium]